mgnify:FL=1|tara:strand:+ start:198 stop:1349 length:1152 start_codon:yes stop_codon:yes gene_type:complete
MENKENIAGFEVFSSPEEIVASTQDQQTETVTEETPQQESQVVSEPTQEAVPQGEPEVFAQPQEQQNQVVETPQQEVNQQPQTEEFNQASTPEPTQYSNEEIEGAVFSYLSEKLGKDVASFDDIVTTPQPLDERVDAISRFVQETGRSPQEWFTYQSLNTSEMDDMTSLKVETAIQYPNLTADEVGTLVQSKYKLDPDLYTEQEVKVGNLQMKVDAAKAKQKIEDERMRYMAPEVQQQAASTNETFITEDWVSEMRSEADSLTGLEFDLGNDKTFTFGLDDRYKQELVNKNTHLDEYFDSYVRDDGSWDFDTLNSHRAIVDNIDAIVSSTYRQGLSDGQKNIVQNASNIQAQTPNQTASKENPLVGQIKSLIGNQSNKLTFKI